MSGFEARLPLCTVRLVGIINGTPVSTGTGFYYFFNDTFTDGKGNVNKFGSARLGIVTNKHVVEGMEEILYYFNTTDEGEKSYQKERMRVKLDDTSLILHPEEGVDLCVILADGIKERLEQNKKKLHIYPVTKNIRINENQLRNMNTIQNLLMIGYPNGIWDQTNNLPIMRKGINATPLHEDYQGDESFAVDIATYKGSSGSPVFIYDHGAYIEEGKAKFGSRLFFVGVIKQAHANSTKVNEQIEIEEMLHIGIAIKAHKLDVFEDLIRQHYEN